MRSVLGVAALLGLMAANLAAQEPSPDEAAKKDQEALQGTWQLEQLEVAGKKTTEDLKKVAATITIEGTTITFQSGVNKEGRKGTFTLDASKTPRWIDLEDGKKTRELGIYTIEGDTLKVCATRTGAERPKEFASKAMPESNLMIFKRAKK